MTQPTTNLNDAASVLDSVLAHGASLTPSEPASAHRYDPVELRAKATLERIVEEGRVRADAILDKIEAEMPQDFVARHRAIRVDVTDGKLKVVLGDAQPLDLHEHARRQMADRAGVPGSYVEELLGSEWGKALAAHNLTESLRNASPTAKALVRTVKGVTRGFLSDSYRRLDSRPLANAVVTAATAIGAIPVEGLVTDVRTSLRVILPTVIEVTPGEFIVFGGEWSNSDYGSGANAFRRYLLRLVCRNGAIGESLARQVHLGARLSEDVAYSARTYEYDTRATASALNDTVRHHLGPAAVAAQVAQIQKANEAKLDPKAAAASLRKALTKTEVDAVTELFTSADVEMLPAGQTAWRWSNAISRFAVLTEKANPARSIELAEQAGKVLLAA